MNRLAGSRQVVCVQAGRWRPADSMVFSRLSRAVKAGDSMWPGTGSPALTALVVDVEEIDISAFVDVSVDNRVDVHGRSAVTTELLRAGYCRHVGCAQLVDS